MRTTEIQNFDSKSHLLRLIEDVHFFHLFFVSFFTILRLYKLVVVALCPPVGIECPFYSAFLETGE